MSEYRGYRITRGNPTRNGARAYVATRGNLALMDPDLASLVALIDARARYDG